MKEMNFLMDKNHCSVTVKGKVQGVWFRKYTLEKASALGLAGTVENLPNGDVYVELEGEPNELEAMISWLKVGSPKSKVEEVLVKVGNLKGFEKFEIIH